MNRSSRSLHLPLIVDPLLTASTVLLLGLAVCALLISALPVLVALLLAVLTAVLGILQIRALVSSRWRGLVIDPEQGHALIDASGCSSACRLLGHGSAGPWLILRLGDDADRLHTVLLRRGLLGDASWRRLRSLLRLLSDDELVGHPN